MRREINLLSALRLPRLLALGAAVLGGSLPFLAQTEVSPTRSGSVTTAAGRVEVTPVNDHIFRVRHYPAGRDVRFLESQSAVLPAGGNNLQTAVFADYVELAGPRTTVRIDKKTGRVTFLGADGAEFLAEAGGIDNSDPDVKTVTLLNTGGQNFYGAGERGHSLRLNGDTLTMYNRQNYGYIKGDPRISQMGISVPYFLSDKGYGVLFDDHAKGELTLGNDTITYSSETPYGLSYYVITPEGTGDLSDITSGYTELTGRQPLPPLWTLGYITSKYGYKTREEAEEVIARLKKDGYPVDGMVLDLYWYGVEQDMGRLEWNPEQWPGHAEMLKNLKDQGVNMVLISQPYINKGGAIDNYNLLSEQGMLVKDADGNTHDVTTWVGDAGMFDMSNPDTRRWLWNRLKGLTAEGVAGWWGDLGEPEVHPSTIMHHNGMTAEQYHNVYGNEWSRLIYEGLREDFPDQRPLLMMRGGTAGLQRYGVFPWTTDVSRSWGGLQPQVNLMLSSGLSGLGYMGSDVGGFAVDPANPTDQELYVRWLQMGAFSPMLRTHAQEQPEPYNYPAVADISKRFIKMRYEWLPYNYTLAMENTLHGWPLARPLNFRGDNPGEKYAEIDDEYLWGDEVLVAPVMKAGARSRKVVFPAGEWVNWNNPALTYKGGTTATVQAPLKELPLFVRAGSFIPLYEQPIENVTQYNPSSLTINYFPSKETTEYTLLEDDMKTPAAGVVPQMQKITFRGDRRKNIIAVALSAEGSYEGCPPVRELTFAIRQVERKPKTVTLSDGKVPDWSYDASKRCLTVRLSWSYAPEVMTVIL